MAEHTLIPVGVQGGDAIPMEKFPFRLGAGRENDLILAHGGVSERHCVIIQESVGLILEDRGSETGTFVNGLRIRRRHLDDGDQLRIGAYSFLYQNRLAREAAITQEPTEVLTAEDEPGAENEAADDRGFSEDDAITDKGLPRAKLLLYQNGTIIREIPLLLQVTIIGRSKNCDVSINESEISRNHCRIVNHRNQYFLEDLGSSNGTLLNHELITSRKILHDGDEIAVGPYELIVQFLGGAPRPKTKPKPSPTAPAEPEAGEVPSDTVTQPAIDPQTCPKLVLMEKQGGFREFLLSKTTVTIGREEDNDIMIDDESVSRHHANVTITDLTVIIEDRNSLNGVEINGELTTKAELRRGDLISLGQAHFRFLDPGEIYIPGVDNQRPPVAPVAPPTSVPSNLLWRILPYVLVGLLLLATSALGFALYLHLRSQNDSSPTLPLDFMATPLPTPEHDSAELSEVNELLNHYQWKDALTLLEKLIQQQPDSRAVQRAHDRATGELVNQALLNAANEAFDQGRTSDALSNLAEIPESSVYFRNSTLKKQQIIRLQINEKLRQARTAIQLGRMTDAAAILDAAKQIAESTPELQDEIDELRSQIAVISVGGEAHVAVDERRVRQTLERGDAVLKMGDYQEAQRRYSETEQSGLPADHEFVKQARSQLEWIRNALQFRQQGQEAYQAGNPILASEKWLEMIKLEQARAPNLVRTLRNEVTENLIDALLRAAEMVNSRQQFCQAYTYWKETLELRPSERTARAGIDRLDKRVSEIYREGFFQEESNPRLARERYQRVLEMTCDDHPYHKKAASNLKALVQQR